MKYDSLDTVANGIAKTKEILGTSDLKLWKTDIASAFRLIPIRPAHRPLAWIVFLAGGVPVAAQHLTMMFGAIGSVHHWERVGNFIRTVARKLLHMPVMRQADAVVSKQFASQCVVRVVRFVDDFNSADRAACAEHALQTFIRQGFLKTWARFVS